MKIETLNASRRIVEGQPTQRLLREHIYNFDVMSRDPVDPLTRRVRSTWTGDSEHAGDHDDPAAGLLEIRGNYLAGCAVRWKGIEMLLLRTICGPYHERRSSINANDAGGFDGDESLVGRQLGDEARVQPPIPGDGAHRSESAIRSLVTHTMYVLARRQLRCQALRQVGRCCRTAKRRRGRCPSWKLERI